MNILFTEFKNIIQSCVNVSLIVFMFLLCIYNNASDQFIIQTVYFFLTLLTFNIGINGNLRLRGMLFIIMLFQVICTTLILEFDLVDTPPDGAFYRWFAERFTEEGLYFLYNNSYDFADWGFKFIVGPIYVLFGVEYGYAVLSVLNIIAHILICYIIYFISSGLYNVKIARIVTLLWGLNLGTVYWNTAFLKETFFCFIIMVAVYYLYKFYKVQRNFRYLLLFIIFTALTAFFRKIFPFFLFAAFGIHIVFKYISPKYFKYILACGLLLTYVAMDFVVYLVPEAEGGFNQREHTFGDGFLSILNIVNPFISPYPAISISNNQTVNVQMAVFASYNIVLAYFVIMGIYHCLKEKVILLYPLLMCLALNSIMLIAYGFSMNYRYIYITSPIAYIVIPYGIPYVRCRWVFVTFLFIVLSITMLYNIR